MSRSLFSFARLSFLRSLSARLLVVTVMAIMLGEVLIYVPSIARYRLVYLEERLAAARLVALAVETAPDWMANEDISSTLLRQVGVEAMVVHRSDDAVIHLGGPASDIVDAEYDLREAEPLNLISDAFDVLFAGGHRTVRVMGLPHPPERDVSVEIIIRESTLFDGMIDYSERILTLSIMLSLLSAVLVYFALHRLMVRPMRHITASMVAFREAPEDSSSVIVPSPRSDELGVAQRELAAMQTELRAALHQKTRMAALGEAMSKINHDLRNILSSAVLVSDRIAQSNDPKVREMTPKLLKVIDRAIALCAETLAFARTETPELHPARFPLRPLAEDVASDLAAVDARTIVWDNRVPADFHITADREHLYRVLLNLARNAVEAMARMEAESEKRLAVRAWRDAEGAAVIEVADTGPGMPEAARAHLFEPFRGAGRGGGTGLGLAIAHDLVKAHGGSLSLLDTGPKGTVFRVRMAEG